MAAPFVLHRVGLAARQTRFSAGRLLSGATGSVPRGRPNIYSPRRQDPLLCAAPESRADCRSPGGGVVSPTGLVTAAPVASRTGGPGRTFKPYHEQARVLRPRDTKGSAGDECGRRKTPWRRTGADDSQTVRRSRFGPSESEHKLLVKHGLDFIDPNSLENPRRPFAKTGHQQFAERPYDSHVVATIRHDGVASDAPPVLSTEQRREQLASMRLLCGAHTVRLITEAKGVSEFLELDRSCELSSTAAAAGKIKRLREIAFAGRSNVGKSRLINVLFNTAILKVQDHPGVTRTINWYRAKKPMDALVVDMPGYGFANSTEELRAHWHKTSLEFFKRKTLVRLVILLDARHGLKKPDYEFLEAIPLTLRLAVVLTKCDLVTANDLARRHKMICNELSEYAITPDDIFMISSNTGAGIIRLREYVLTKAMA